MPQPDKVIKVDKETWDDVVVEDAKTKPNPWNVYGASKTEAERAIWKAVKETNPPFQVACILPNANIGPIMKPDGGDSSSTATWILSLYKGDTSVFDIVPPQWFVDVRDTARLHVVAMIDPECNGQRIFAFAEPMTFNDILAILRKQNPSKTFPKDREGFGKDLSQIPTEDAVALLKKHYGKGFTSMEDSIEALVASVK
jgi:nucleoside-diphosphate-sugar epimerase